MDTNILWEKMGDIEEEDIPHVLTKLFTIYEEQLNVKKDDAAALAFFTHLGQVLEQVANCNLNRR